MTPLAAHDIALGTPSSPLDALDPRARLACAVVLSVAVSSLSSPLALVFASIPSLLLIPCGPVVPLLRALLRLDVANIVMLALLAVTWPGEIVFGPVTREGLVMGALITVRLNVASVALLRLVVSMGPSRTDAALSRLGVPKGLRLLLTLTLRGVAVLAGRTAAALLALRLRAPRLRGPLAWRTFGSLLGASLVRSADRAERMSTAMELRGGPRGLTQPHATPWRARDGAACLACAVFVAAAIGIQLMGP
ncbi:MAG: hypothetical protein IJR14_11985 [Synergistaceae bacterium]|nr:hypothetical protein [Synergistaceae bacterium]